MKTLYPLLILLLASLSSRPVSAGEARRSEGITVLPPAAREVDIDEHLGRAIDPSLTFTNELGETARLGDYFHDDKPVVLVLAYYRCPMLCDLVLRKLVGAMKLLPFHLGKEYRALTVSIDPRDEPAAAAKKQSSVLAGLAEPDKTADWPFLVGDATASQRLADELGFRYAYDPGTDQYAHPAVVVTLTPEGKISRYLYGVDISARDLRLGLLDATEGKVGTIVDRVIMTCYHFDPATRKYGPFIWGFMRVGAAIIFASVSILVGVLLHIERKRRKATGEGGGGS